MINLIYEKGEFRFEKAFESVTPQTMDVFLTVKDVVPDTQQPDLTQQACLFINKKLGTEYSTEGLGDFSKTEEKTIVSISGFKNSIAEYEKPVQYLWSDKSCRL